MTRSPPSSVAARIGWAELCTTDSEKSARFYAHLLGWERRALPLGQNPRSLDYWLHLLQDRPVAGSFGMVGAQRKRGVQPHWLCHVFVADAAAAIEHARSLRANVLAEPMDVGAFGRLALLRDPQGALFGLWEARELGLESQARGELGCMTRFEHASADPRGAARFYASLCGWTARESAKDETVVLEQGGERVASVRSSSFESAQLAPQWFPYVRVAECGEACRKVEELRGSLLAAPRADPEAVCSAIARDPLGAPLGLLSTERA